MLLGRFSMFTGWYEMVMKKFRPNTEFVSADVRALNYKNASTYEMLSRDRESKTADQMESQPITPLSPVAKSGRETPDYFSREVRYQPPVRSFSNPRPPQGGSWDPTTTQARPFVHPGLDPLSMNKI
jgi:hypothetical protein